MVEAHDKQVLLPQLLTFLLPLYLPFWRFLTSLDLVAPSWRALWSLQATSYRFVRGLFYADL